MEKSRNKNTRLDSLITSSRARRGGQIMLLSIMILGGVMLSASMIAGLLLRHQIRQVNDAVSSAKAVFAADTGIELVSWCWFTMLCNPQDPPSITFEDNSTYFTIESEMDSDTNTLTINAQGFSGKTLRILEAVFASE